MTVVKILVMNQKQQMNALLDVKENAKEVRPVEIVILMMAVAKKCGVTMVYVEIAMEREKLSHKNEIKINLKTFSQKEKVFLTLIN